MLSPSSREDAPIGLLMLPGGLQGLLRFFIVA